LTSSIITCCNSVDDTLTLKNVHFVKLSKCGMDFVIAFLLLRWSKNIYGMSNSESGWRIYAPGTMLHCRDFWPKLELLTCTRARTSGSSLNFWPALELKLLAQAKTFGKPNKKGCMGLAYWIPIRTVLNSWETWKIRLEEISYWDKTTPSIYMRGSCLIEFLSIQSSKTQHINYYLP
jgi:hypothetical protein